MTEGADLGPLSSIFDNIGAVATETGLADSGIDFRF
jgi:hypothetical protein